MPDYLISVAHHSVSRSRVVKYSGSLAGAIGVATTFSSIAANGSPRR